VTRLLIWLVFFVSRAKKVHLRDTVMRAMP